jgi:hypothetical protein
MAYVGLDEVMSSSKLVWHPRPLEQESFLAFLLRLSNSNGYERINPILQSGEYKGKTAESLLIRLFKRDLSFRFLDDLTGFYKGTLESFFSFYQREARENFCIHRPRVCPICIAENGTTHFFVDVSTQVACPRHGVVLLNQCPACHTNIIWHRKHIECCDCGFDFKKSELIVPSNLTLALFDRWKIFIDSVEDEKSRSNTLVFQLAKSLLRPTDSLVSDIDYEYLPVEYLFSALDQACRFLVRPDFLKQFVALSVAVKKKQLPYLIPVTGLKSWTLENIENIEAVADRVPIQIPVGLYFPVYAFDTSYQSLKASDQAELFMVSHRRFIATISKETKEAFSKNDLLSAQAEFAELARALGIQIDSIRSLQEVGWIKPLNYSHKKRNEWLYDLYDANSKMESLYSTSKRITISQGYIALSDQNALRTLGTDVGSILTSDVPLYRHRVPKGFEGLFVKKSYFENRIVTRLVNDHILTLEEAASELQTTKTVICILNRNRAIAGYGDGLGEKLNQVTASALKKFKEQYILLNSIAAENGIRPSTIAKKLLELGYKPEQRFEYGTGAIFIYGKSDELNAKIDDILNGQ